MTDTIQVNEKILNLVKADITDFAIEAFVFYAQHNLELGSGYGTAISMRGGPEIQAELKNKSPLKTTEVIISTAGNLKANHIIHAVGPRFQEEGIEDKLKSTIINILKLADQKNIKEIALPAMGTGFYGIPLPVSARVTLGTVADYLRKDTGIEKVTICLLDNREFLPFQEYMNRMSQAYKEAS